MSDTERGRQLMQRVTDAAVDESHAEVGSASSRRRVGHGLGLSIARRVIDALGGSISLASSGRGAEFLIRIPFGSGGDAPSAS